ncbi:MAG: ABC-type branched-chain amino acid transport system ATP-binding protein [Pseudomonadota bacterium]|jgi:urea ABC transporter ATP-binding protein UrtE|nr:ABC transporter ATP-binding protein [Alphaproteobacteria bacterium]
MTTEVLKINNISAGYGSTTVINSFSFAVNQGEILSITGRNGVGKSTLLKSIMGVIPIKSGNLFFQNEDISIKSSSDRSILGISYVPQGREIFSSLSVEENILLPILVRNKINLKIKLNEIYKLFPILEEKKNNAGSSLSGGQQQQLAIARALVSDPKVILLDEPSEGIQPSIVKFIAETVQKISKTLKTAFIVVEQNISFISQLNSDCLVVDNGRILSKISANELKDIDKAKKLLSLDN